MDLRPRIPPLLAGNYPPPAETLLWTAVGFRAAVVECRYALRPLPVYLSTGPVIVAAG